MKTINRLILVNQRSSIALAIFRFLVALACVFLAITNASELMFRDEPDDVIFMIYLGIATAILPIAIFFTQLDFILYPLYVSIDITLFFLSPFVGLNSQTDAVFVGAGLIILVVMSVRLRWEGVAAINFAVFMNTFAAISFFALQGGMSFGPDAIVRQISFFLIPSAFIIWVVTLMAGARTTVLHVGATSFDADALAQMARACRETLHCRDISLLWIHENGARLGSGGADAANLQALIGGTGPLAGPVGTPGIRSVMLNRRTSVAIRHAGDWPLSWQHGVGGAGEQALALPPGNVIAGRSVGRAGTCIMVASGLKLGAWSDLRTFSTLLGTVQAQCDGLVTAGLVRDTELMSLRNTIARDLHDSVAQSLTGAKFWLAGLMRDAPDDHLRQEIDKLRDALEVEHVGLRAIIETLRAGEHAARSASLGAIIHGTLETLQTHWRIPIAFDDQTGGARNLDAGHTFAIQQLLREAIANAVRHGQADQVTVTCGVTAAGVTLDIVDDGVGFLTEKEPWTVRERVATLDGTLAIESVPGDTRLMIFLPLGASA